jgi:serine phosphatase RsbU (regulator of sigma subunit)
MVLFGCGYDRQTVFGSTRPRPRCDAPEGNGEDRVQVGRWPEADGAGSFVNHSRRRAAVRRRDLAEQRDVNRQLQYAMLPPRDSAMPVNGMRIAVRYEGADRDLDVGGDWYASEPLPGGGLLLAVGDVVGHGLAATAMMVRLRHATAGLAVAGLAPGEILTVLNRLLGQQADGAAATAVVAAYEPDTHRLTWARAGHVPILVATGRGVRPLWHPGGVMLGLLPDYHYAHATRIMGTEEVLLMYTDGFVEAPGTSLDEGVRILAEHAHSALSKIDTVADRSTILAERLHRRNRYDDACLLAAEPMG